jgi:ABC-type tungstate transport system permease subunit
MVSGDPHLRRPYLVVTTTSAADVPRRQAAQRLAAFLRTPATQAWIATYGQGRYDDQPLFFPVEVHEQTLNGTTRRSTDR